MHAPSLSVGMRLGCRMASLLSYPLIVKGAERVGFEPTLR